MEWMMAEAEIRLTGAQHLVSCGPGEYKVVDMYVELNLTQLQP